LLPTENDPTLDAHFDRWGQMPAGSPALISEVERAGLRGRGGAGFPMATKLRSVARGSRTFAVANATEGEPASWKDRALLIGTPHLVLDGLSMAAETVGASEAIICVDRADTAACTAVAAALAERRRADADVVPLRLEGTPSPYVAGEESALVHWLNGGEAKPTFVPPRPYQRGVRGRPTLINNAETLAHMGLIARFGAEWYRSLGTAEDPGTALLTVTGDVARPGVYEHPFGTPLPHILDQAGWRGEAAPQAILIGGYSGTWVAGPAVSGLTLETRSLAHVGATVGCGAISVIGPRTCGLREVARVARWLAGQSAGQCGPCALGLPAIATAVEAMAAGGRQRRQGNRLPVWLDTVPGRGACHHPDGAVRFVRSGLNVFANEIDNHRRHGPCPGRDPVLPLSQPAGGWR
jgi:NADH:ubiquinone oxidoreductase subunit F (NADH-binding)